MSLFYVIFGILLFGLMVGVHELGHFLVAKLCGVRVEEFAFGMGPALWKKQKGETLYAIRLIPFGGYCAMAGENEELDDPRAFTSQPPWKRLPIVLAGPAMSFLLGLVIVVALYSGAYAFRTSQIVDFMPGCPYEREDGLHKGDEILRIDGQRILHQSDISDFLAQGGDVHELVVLREGRRVTLRDFELVPLEYEGQSGRMYGFYFGYEPATPGVVLKNAWHTSLEFARWVWMGLRELVRGNVKADDVSGPVAIVDYMAETGEAAESVSDALYEIFYFAAFITINLAIMNLLPIPALDGGRIFLLLVTWPIEAIRGKKLNPKYEAYVHATGMILLLALMAVVMFHDIVRLFTK